ncbi:hypothetical protein [Actinomarinicola tropica]|uniref:Cbb3-type cytochrome c oxidase subunit I n=1 Tax=Actinomarinicola tropica TaxID=2789776 RepID=A0A5Q2RGF0_9ACTN|nr:hypothetical protein [Actinomarinicola tropica]QGG93681.1 hypothetical protein GH723_00330 [Actinomarinicola tropica]
MTAIAPPTPMVPPVAVPGPGAPDVVPPPALPLAFLGAAGVGLTGLGLAVWFAADRLVTAPTHPGAVSAVHVAMLAFLTTGVLGALHQFAPVVARRPLRSVRAGWVTLVGMVATAWILPSGFAHGPEALVATGGVVGTATVGLAVWNLSGPLSSRDGGLPLWGLRFSVAYLAITVLFGVVYAFDRQTGWFPLVPHRVLAHAHLGLVGWLGLTYVAVAEKLWPMFLLAHRPHDREGQVAVWSLVVAAPILTVGLLFGIQPIGWIGGLLAAVGLCAHVASLLTCVRHRRRKLELLHAFLFTSAAFLLLALALAEVGGLFPMSPGRRSDVVAAEVAALVGWLGLAIVGHVHKIVPFIGYSALRARGIRARADGSPLLFAHLFRPGPARAALALGTAGFTLVVGGLLAVHATSVAVGGIALAACGATTTANLALTPRRILREASS